MPSVTFNNPLIEKNEQKPNIPKVFLIGKVRI